MPELLLELFSEEIPARMQARASEDLMRLLCSGLKDAGLDIGAAQAFATPRRLCVKIDDVPLKSPAVKEERKGPRVGAPEKAIEGFMRGAGLSSIEDAQIVSDPKKGDFYVSISQKPGRDANDIVAELVPNIVRQFPWPKSMKWGAGKLRWVRPLHSILCMLGGEAVGFDIEGIKSGKVTAGHRFMAPATFDVASFADYEEKLRGALVILDPMERAELILKGAQKLAKAKKLDLVEDDDLLKETAGLVEWPVVLMGTFDEAFLEVPAEVLVSSMKSHQKYFSLKKDGKLSNHFILVSNLAAEDDGAAIRDGNERVIRARLSDAKFFWEQDLAQSLDARLPKLKEITFHEKLGSQWERVERLKALARGLAPLVGADPNQAARAAELCKGDLVTEMVGEFPELQGLMGRYYAEKQGEPREVSAAIDDHYKPQGPGDHVPSAPVSISLALADKIDILTGFWSFGEKPTGSKDPYALRRAALGVIRVILENKLRLNLVTEADRSLQNHQPDEEETALFQGGTVNHHALDLLSFFADRLKVYLRDKGARHDLIDAVFSLGGEEGGQGDLLMIVKRVEALGNFLETDDGTNLLAGAKRAQNILRIEEKKDGKSYDGDVDDTLLTEDHESALAAALTEARQAVKGAAQEEDFEAAMAALAKLRTPVDAFFDHVTVNADEPDLRENRLKLLSQIRQATRDVADFSRIEG